MNALKLAAAIFAVLTGASVQAHEYKKDGLQIGHPWAKPSLEGVKAGAAFFTVTNNGDADDKLLSAQSEAAETAELHAHILNADVVKMRKLDDGVTAPARATLKFEPGGLHVMLIGLKRKLAEGDKIPMTLTFEKAGPIAVEVNVEKGPAEPQGGGHGHQH
jgi:hypothetical protein